MCVCACVHACMCGVRCVCAECVLYVRFYVCVSEVYCVCVYSMGHIGGCGLSVV